MTAPRMAGMVAAATLFALGSAAPVSCRAEPPWLPVPTVAPDAGWTKVRFMYTRHPPPGQERLAALLERYGPRKTKGLPGLVVTYAVIATPNGRTVVATTASDAACEPVANGFNVRLAPDPCPTHVITLSSSGTARAQTLSTGCFLWTDTDAPTPEPVANATYVGAAGALIELRTLIDGRPVPACKVAVAP